MSLPIGYLKAAGIAIHVRMRGSRGRFRFLKHQTARVFPEVISRDLCLEIADRIDRILADDQSSRIWRDATCSDSRILQFEKDIPDLLPHFDINGCIDAIDAYLGSRTRSWLLMANKVVPKEGNAGSGGGLHRDSPFSHQVKCILYLCDVTNANGPFSYVPGTHRNLIGQRHRYPLGTYRFDNVPDQLETVTAPAGSLLVCDTRAVHGGKPIVEGVRYAVTLYTFTDAEGISRLYRNSGLI
jgi:hypothetical protein